MGTVRQISRAYIWCELKKLDQSTASVLIYLVLRAKEDTGQCWPSRQGIAGACRISSRSVTTALKALRRLDIVVTIGWHGRVPLYQVDLKKIEQETEGGVQEVPVILATSSSQESNGCQSNEQPFPPDSNKILTVKKQESKTGVACAPPLVSLEEEAGFQAEEKGNEMKQHSHKLHIHKGKKKAAASIHDIDRPKGIIVVVSRQTLQAYWKQQVADKESAGFQLSLTGVERGQLNHLAKAFEYDWGSLQSALDAAFGNWSGFRNRIYQDTGKHPKETAPTPGMVLFYKASLVKHWQLIAKKKKIPSVTATQATKGVLPTLGEQDKIAVEDVKTFTDTEKAGIEEVLKDF